MPQPKRASKPNSNLPSDQLVRHAARLPFFNGLTRQDLEKIAPYLEWRQVPAQTILIEEGARGDSMYFIESGKVLISKKGRAGQTQGITILSSGDFFGEMSLLESQPRSASAMTLEDTQVISISGKNFFTWLRRDPKKTLLILINGLRTVSERLRETTGELTSLHSLGQSLLEAQTKETVYSSVAEELSRLIGARLADGGVLYSFNPYVEEYVSEKHWGKVPGALLTSLKEIGSPHKFPIGPESKNGYLLLVEPKAGALLRKSPLLEIIAGMTHQALVRCQALLEDSLKSQLKSSSVNI